MAKRIFEIAKELEIPSKEILTKLKAEGIPNMNNHMSSVSAGLEATIREWFSDGGAADEGGGATTAVETAAKVDVTRVRAKAKRKTTPEEPPKQPATAKAAPATPPPAEKEDAPETPKSTPTAPAKEPPKAPPAPAAPAAPAAPEQAEAPEPRESEPSAPEKPSEPLAPAATRDEPSGDESDSGKVEMNVPRRPTAVSPAGPQLTVQKPTKLSGPKVVRVEAPDVIDAPRQRRSGPPGGPSMPSGGPRGGAGVRGPGGPAPAEDDQSRSPRRNKRRGGGKQPRGAGAPSGPPSGGGKLEDPGSFNWRQQDLLERQERLTRSGGFLRQRRRDMKRDGGSGGGQQAQTPAQTGGPVRIAAPFSIKDLSAATGVKAADIVKKLFMQGVMATVNSGIEPEKAEEIMLEYDIELEIESKKSAEQVVEEQFGERDSIDERPRSPVVAILGHVDHGKTSLLDRIRNTKVAEREAGGITQATSAFRVPVKVGEESKQVCFLDTPGHEAFTAMRARGAHMTDIIVLVVAADDGVMPQTVESINHAKAAGVPIVVALNKIDKPEATDSNIQRILGQLGEKGLNPTEWGGDTEVIRTSATSGKGIEELLEVLDYQAQLLELKADFKGHASGSVVEAHVAEGRGPVATALVQNGELSVGDFIVAGRAYGRVRDILDDEGKRTKSAGPSMPVLISGLDEIPAAGDSFYVVDTLKKAQEAAETRRHRDRERELAQPKVTLDSILSQMRDSDVKELMVVVKADVQGSVDVIRESIEEISTDDVRVRVLHAAVGGINESDIVLAEASRAVVIGFNVIPSSKARRLAEQKSIEIRTYQVIYDIVDDVRKAAEGLLEPEQRQEILGHAEVRAVFRISRVGAVAGCYVTDGSIERNAFVRVTRGDIVIENDRVLEQLKRFKDDAKEVKSGQECGMKIVGYDDIKEGDILECYRKIEVKRTL